jgi:hypothetical protein
MGKKASGFINYRNYNKAISIILLSFMAVFYSCKKDDDFKKYALPDNVIPKDKGAAEYGTTTNLKWASSSEAGSKYNIYFGETDNPALYKSGEISQSLNVPVIPGHKYFWRIGSVDRAGTEMLSPVYSFKVKILLNIDKFTGVFDCKEPKYSNYEVTVSKVSNDTLMVDNFWDLKWKLKYTFDALGNVKIVPKSFSPDPSLTYFVTGAGTYNDQTNEFSVNYNVQQMTQGHPPVSVDIEDNMHIFKKK